MQYSKKTFLLLCSLLVLVGRPVWAQSITNQTWVFASVSTLSNDLDFDFVKEVGDKFDKCKLSFEDDAIDITLPGINYYMDCEYQPDTKVLKIVLGDKDKDKFLNFLRSYEYKCYLEKESLIWEFLQVDKNSTDKKAKRMFKLIFKKA